MVTKKSNVDRFCSISSEITDTKLSLMYRWVENLTCGCNFCTLWIYVLKYDLIMIRKVNYISCWYRSFIIGYQSRVSEYRLTLIHTLCPSV